MRYERLLCGAGQTGIHVATSLMVPGSGVSRTTDVSPRLVRHHAHMQVTVDFFEDGRSPASGEVVTAEGDRCRLWVGWS